MDQAACSAAQAFRSLRHYSVVQALAGASGAVGRESALGCGWGRSRAVLWSYSGALSSSGGGGVVGIGQGEFARGLRGHVLYQPVHDCAAVSICYSLRAAFVGACWEWFGGFYTKLGLDCKLRVILGILGLDDFTGARVGSGPASNSRELQRRRLVAGSVCLEPGCSPGSGSPAKFTQGWLGKGCSHVKSCSSFGIPRG